PRTLIHAGYQGTLGYVVPTAMGAQVANPDKKVIAVTGDGGFMFNVQELATAAQHNIPVVIILMNDGAFGNVKRNQKEDWNEQYLGVDLQNPDFMKLADAYGIMGQRVDSPEGLRGAIQNAFKQDGPALIEVTVGEMPSAWQYMPLVRAKDQSSEK
ncbi:MAG: thiamine pyrophosphate-dependent enzyme, partial [Rhodospirillales bacterium]|nr:thiamine pyrophosphate-dependent enzyme [Rhodospirillales bacterium]